jgi:predicted N-acetyltransferase YhbS
MEVKLLLSSDMEAITDYEKSSMPSHLSPIEIEMNSWDTSWRRESLEHYTNLGWSFVAIENEHVVGYILAQPLLFLNKWTQSLWIEDINYDNEEIGYNLMDVTIRWAKTKHLQKIITNNNSLKILKIQNKFDGFKEQNFSHLSTTKMSED